VEAGLPGQEGGVDLSIQMTNVMSVVEEVTMHMTAREGAGLTKAPEGQGKFIKFHMLFFFFLQGLIQQNCKQECCKDSKQNVFMLIFQKFFKEHFEFFKNRKQTANYNLKNFSPLS
jgi:hypothetical protein